MMRKKLFLSKFTILYWATFIGILCPWGRELDTPVRVFTDKNLKSLKMVSLTGKFSVSITSLCSFITFLDLIS